MTVLDSTGSVISDFVYYDEFDDCEWIEEGFVNEDGVINVIDIVNLVNFILSDLILLYLI